MLIQYSRSYGNFSIMKVYICHYIMDSQYVAATVVLRVVVVVGGGGGVCVSSPIISRRRLSKNPPIVARQQVSRKATAVTNTYGAIEELLDASFSMWPMWYQGK
jgi:hypothetical protein